VGAASSRDAVFYITLFIAAGSRSHKLATIAANVMMYLDSKDNDF